MGGFDEHDADISACTNTPISARRTQTASFQTCLVLAADCSTMHFLVNCALVLDRCRVIERDMHKGVGESSLSVMFSSSHAGTVGSGRAQYRDGAQGK